MHIITNIDASHLAVTNSIAVTSSTPPHYGDIEWSHYGDIGWSLVSSVRH